MTRWDVTSRLLEATELPSIGFQFGRFTTVCTKSLVLKLRNGKATGESGFPVSRKRYLNIPDSVLDGPNRKSHWEIAKRLILCLFGNFTTRSRLLVLSSWVLSFSRNNYEYLCVQTKLKSQGLQWSTNFRCRERISCLPLATCATQQSFTTIYSFLLKTQTTFYRTEWTACTSLVRSSAMWWWWWQRTNGPVNIHNFFPMSALSAV